MAVMRKSFYSTAVFTAGTVRLVHQNTKHGLRIKLDENNLFSFNMIDAQVLKWETN